MVLLDGTADEDDLLLAARLTARYCQGRNAAQVSVRITSTEGLASVVVVTPMSISDIPADWLL